MNARLFQVYRILVVDGEMSIRLQSARALIRAGYGVDAAEDGAVAWKALNFDRYDLLITENHMPNLSGVELVKKVRAVRMNLPVIMTTGESTKEEPSWLQPAARLLKPFTTAELLLRVKEVLCQTARGREEIAPLPSAKDQGWAHRKFFGDRDRGRGLEV
jgi:DNA-binding response OmpR family regulator